jgi:hypothetical protein
MEELGIREEELGRRDSNLGIAHKLLEENEE